MERLQCVAIPALLSRFTRMVTKLEEQGEEEQDREKDPVLDWMQQVLTALTGANTNPAIIVQVFARLFHTVNSALFNFLIKSPRGPSFHTRVTPAWGTVLHGWIHGSLNLWALDNGLHLVADCYLQRLSQVILVIA
ncbi:hypothetical protein Ciccas_014610 [Cichlidogyrus casuarinus]|uniref:Dilute domain-containing protein n=1 Tax=Cichlidogyrus casuarinus TaxID=1844966 RepID=A0ABD2PI25_9PLAT